MTLLNRWTAEDEMHRAGDLAAGLEPRLHRCWVTTPTVELVAALAEYRTLNDPSLTDLISDLETEIAYRTDPA